MRRREMKIIQILSHYNTLYALDDEGNIYKRTFTDAYGIERFVWTKQDGPILKDNSGGKIAKT